MKLIPASKVVDFLDASNIEAIANGANGAISVATAVLEATLDTLFTRASKSDVFMVTSSSTLGTSWVTKLMLSRSFLAGTPTFSYAPTMDSFGTSDESASLSFVWDDALGLGTEITTNLTGKFVKIDYSYGFEPDTDPEVYKQDQVPDWLKEACMILAISNMSNTPIMENVKSAPDAKLLMKQYDAIVKRHVRYAPGSSLPF